MHVHTLDDLLEECHGELVYFTRVPCCLRCVQAIVRHFELTYECRLARTSFSEHD